MSPPHVIVAGAGPVGCVAAAVLGERGVRVTLLEAEPALPRQLRASTFHPATLELLHPFGVVPDMISRGLIADRFSYRDRQVGEVASFNLEAISDITQYPFRLQCEQYKLCEILLERFAENPLVTVRFGAPVVSASQTDPGVKVVLEDGSSLSADGLIGADGASSAVRKSLDLTFDGMTYADRYLVVSTPYELADHIDGLSYVNYISDPDEWLVLLRTVDLWRALFPVPEGESDDDALSDESAQRRLQGVYRKPQPYEIAHRTIYNVHQRVADKFRVGNILLAGDAAHINNPLGGMGMNGGVHDAVLLGASMAGYLNGTVSSERLDHFAELRRKLALDFVQRYTHENAVTLATNDAEVRSKALAQMTERAAGPESARDYILQASMIKALWSMKDELQELDAYPF